MFFLTWRFSKRLEHYSGMKGPFYGGKPSGATECLGDDLTLVFFEVTTIPRTKAQSLTIAAWISGHCSRYSTLFLFAFFLLTTNDPITTLWHAWRLCFTALWIQCCTLTSWGPRRLTECEDCLLLMIADEHKCGYGRRRSIWSLSWNGCVSVIGCRAAGN